MSTLHHHERINLQQTVVVYESSTASSSPASLSPDGFLSFFLYLYVSVSGTKIDELNSEFPNVEFTSETDDNGLEAGCEDLDPLLFFYYASLIPKNITDNSPKYQGNKAEGLVRAGYQYGRVLDKGDYIVGKDPVTCARDFLDSNRELMAKIYACYLSYALPDRMKGAAATYAEETSKSITYVYMVGVMMIERVLVNKHSLVLTDVNLVNHYKEYCKFKSICKSMYQEFWVYSGVLAPNCWNAYKSTPGFLHLWVIAGLLSDGVQFGLQRIKIGGNNVMTYNTDPFYKNIVARYNVMNTTSKPSAVPNNLHAQSTIDMMNSRYAQWSGNTERASTVGGESSAFETLSNLD